MSKVRRLRNGPKTTILAAKATTTATVAAAVAVVAVAAEIVKTGRARGSCQGASGSGDRPFLRRLTLLKCSK